MEAQKGAGTINSSDARDLKKVCDKVDIVFLYPVVLCIEDITKIVSTRLSIAGSGLVGSSEYLIKDLDETEFTFLFFDYDPPASDLNFQNLVIDEMTKPGSITTGPSAALSILQGRC